MAVQLKRDPFARATLMREKAEDWQSQNGCKCCGKLGSMYYYYWENDYGRRAPDSRMKFRQETKPFCSVGCYREYYDEERR